MTRAENILRLAGPRRLTPYPAYKNSGVECLGEIPVTWEVRALKRLGSMQAGTAITSQDIEPDGEYPVLNPRIR